MTKSKKTPKKTTAKKATKPKLPAYVPPSGPSALDLALNVAAASIPALVTAYKDLCVGQDLATRAALAALPSVVSQGGTHTPAETVAARAFEIGDAFAAKVRLRAAPAAPVISPEEEADASPKPEGEAK